MIVVLSMLSVPLFGLSFPTVFFFPFSTSFEFDLYSGLGNTISVECNSITMSENYETSGIAYFDWDVSCYFYGEYYNFSIEFMVDDDDDVYITEFSDPIYYRSLFNSTLFFPSDITYGEAIDIGNNMTLTYVDYYSSVYMDGVKYSNVYQANLYLDGYTLIMYIGKKSGIEMIQTPAETFHSY